MLTDIFGGPARRDVAGMKAAFGAISFGEPASVLMRSARYGAYLVTGLPRLSALDDVIIGGVIVAGKASTEKMDDGARTIRRPEQDVRAFPAELPDSLEGVPVAPNALAHGDLVTAVFEQEPYGRFLVSGVVTDTTTDQGLLTVGPWILATGDGPAPRCVEVMRLSVAGEHGVAVPERRTPVLDDEAQPSTPAAARPSASTTTSRRPAAKASSTTAAKASAVVVSGGGDAPAASAPTVASPAPSFVPATQPLTDLNFTAVDVETANGSYASICQIAAVQVRGGEIVGQESWFVAPHPDVAEFDARNIAVHGITEAHVVGAASWTESLRKICELAGDHPLVAFNANFDKTAMRQASELAGLDMPGNDFHCALILARRTLNLPKYRLNNVAEHLGFGGFNHHDAGEDARVAAQVVLEIARRESATSIEDLWPRVVKEAAAPRGGNPKFFAKGYSTKKADLPQPNPDAAPGHPLYGQTVVLTGELESMSRWDAMEHIARLGGINGTNVTRATTVLIVGDGRREIDAERLASGSSKEKKVAAMLAKGVAVAVHTEESFTALLS